MLLDVQDLTVTLQTAAGPGRAVRDLSLRLDRGQTLGIVGESGCGKSMTALALIGLLPENAATSGRVLLDGDDLLAKDEAALCDIRGNRIAMIFQEPMTSLNPVHRIGRQIAEPLRLHRGLDDKAARAEALRLLDRVGMPNAARRIDAYPHELSGGQRQRAMIAIALSCGPDLLIADEPTTALDVTIQGQILELIGELVREDNMALVLISHDLGVIAETVDNVLVMYGGLAVERGPAARLFQRLAHPYSQGLFRALPRLEPDPPRLATIAGSVPELAELPAGCPFAGRCPLTIEACWTVPPPVEIVSRDHSAACHRLQVAMLHEERAG
jgi:peptide/nickel transport system ATP-binding protein